MADCEDKQAGNRRASGRRTDQRTKRNRFPCQCYFAQQRSEKGRQECGAFMPCHDGRVGCDMPHFLDRFALGSRNDHVCMDREHGDRTWAIIDVTSYGLSSFEGRRARERVLAGQKRRNESSNVAMATNFAF